ncbi:MAG: hypothetical protein ACRDJI_00020 [Actinomycetota bacterium]
MTKIRTAPQGIRFTYETASKALDDQLQWIETLDTKAGILMAADGVVVGLVLTRGSFLQGAPAGLATAGALLLFASFLMALLAFATRRYETAPDLAALLALLRTGDDDFLRWNALPGIVGALDVNESKLGQKADLLFVGNLLLLGGIFVVAGYFIYWLWR